MIATLEKKRSATPSKVAYRDSKVAEKKLQSLSVSGIDSFAIKLADSSIWSLLITRTFLTNLKLVEDSPKRDLILERICKLSRGEWPAAFIQDMKIRNFGHIKVYPFKKRRLCHQ